MCKFGIAIGASILALTTSFFSQDPQEAASKPAIAFTGDVITSFEVQDVKASAKWYREVLGCEMFLDLSEMGWCEITTPVTKSLIGLGHPEEGEAQKPSGGAKLSFGVADVEAALTKLKSHGVETGEIVEMLRNRSRPYLFSNTLPLVIVAATLKVLDLLSETTELRDKLEESTLYFRAKLQEAGFDVKNGVHPIIPIMLGDARLAAEVADAMLDEGIYVVGFSYPVVPQGTARIRVQISAGHEREHLDRAIEAFIKVGRAKGVI